MISDHIQDLITAASDLPKSESKNRGLSHLKDALAHFQVLEMYDMPVASGNPTKSLGDVFLSMGKGGCTCPMWPDAVDTNCPVHSASYRP